MIRVELLEQAKFAGSGSIIAKCPACAAVGADNQGNHLKVYKDGRFCCVVNPGPAGKFHRQEIFRLVGDKTSLPERPPAVRMTIRVRKGTR